jgi:3-hydroxyacyl-CoA dehydrogenase/enoyl-CoA hydratase/3-hydroxybutyryl-CoA epimerase
VKDKMQPIEIIRGEKTSDETVARAVDYALAIRKYPIVVNDSRGFFTSRVFATYLQEACAMLDEGIDPATIEQAGYRAGYPAAPMQLADELNFTTMRKIQQEVAAGLRAEGKQPTQAGEAALGVVETMIETYSRTGKLGGAGFYDYADGKRTRIWPELRAVFDTSAELKVPFDDLIDRFLFVQALRRSASSTTASWTPTPTPASGRYSASGIPRGPAGSDGSSTGAPAARPRSWSAPTTSPRVTGNGSSHRRPCASRAYRPAVP